jgi:hypothetical protein
MTRGKRKGPRMSQGLFLVIAVRVSLVRWRISRGVRRIIRTRIGAASITLVGAWSYAVSQTLHLLFRNGLDVSRLRQMERDDRFRRNVNLSTT